MSNPTVSFRISNYHLARGLRAVRTIEPSWEMTTPGELIRTIFNDYIAKSEHFNNQPLEISQELLQEIAASRLMIKQPQNEKPAQLPRLGKVKKSIQQTERERLDEELFNQLRKESLHSIRNNLTDQQIENIISESKITEVQKRLPKPSEFHDPNKTDSKISTITDFSPPKEWIDQE